MAKDYERRKPTRQKNSTPRQFFWVLASFLCGYLTASIFDFNSVNHWVHQNILAKEEPQPKAKEIARQKELPKPKFEFYTLLTKDHRASVPLPKPVLTTPAQLVEKPQNGTPAAVVTANPVATVSTAPPISKPLLSPGKQKESYLVQLASFKSNHDAERLKAALILKGFDVRIAVAPPQQGGWFRVILGPYTSRLEAEKIQVEVARSEHLKGMVRKLDA
ncbi:MULTISPECIES: SPOR domain-containing protein [unclassified Legionella]|uniref:SPOR domain-containing protein n=1 Tax=unclassified Legionella TaxID=2622702 RepID=UPI0010557555|nr:MULTISPECIES: SPOR domain-containing protein [unclassified Legionella]MDI9817934.1 SPOR domain-containing protein [Legionella sp. PL877]